MKLEKVAKEMNSKKKEFSIAHSKCKLHVLFKDISLSF